MAWPRCGVRWACLCWVTVVGALDAHESFVPGTLCVRSMWGRTCCALLGFGRGACPLLLSSGGGLCTLALVGGWLVCMISFGSACCLLLGCAPLDL